MFIGVNNPISTVGLAAFYMYRDRIGSAPNLILEVGVQLEEYRSTEDESSFTPHFRSPDSRVRAILG